MTLTCKPLIVGETKVLFNITLHKDPCMSLKLDIRELRKTDINNIYLCRKIDNYFVQIQSSNDFKLNPTDVLYFVTKSWENFDIVKSLETYNEGFLCKNELNDKSLMMFKHSSIDALFNFIKELELFHQNNLYLQLKTIWEKDGEFWVEMAHSEHQWIEFRQPMENMQKYKMKFYTRRTLDFFSFLEENHIDTFWFLDHRHCFIDEEQQLRFILPNYTVNDGFKEDDYVFQFARMLISMLTDLKSYEISLLVQSNTLSTAIQKLPEDIVHFLEPCIVMENEYRPSMTKLLNSEFLDLTGTNVYRNLLKPEETIELAVDYNQHGPNEVLDLIQQKLGMSEEDIFLDENENRPVQDYNKIHDVSYVIMSSTKNLDCQKSLGKGGFCEVSAWLDCQSGQTFAMKKFENAITNPILMASFMREVKILPLLKDSQRIITLYACHHEQNKSLFLRMELMQVSLKDVVMDQVRRFQGGLNLEDIRKYSYGITEAIKFMHSKNVIHRDIKSDNVLLDCTCSVKVADFGLAKTLPEGKLDICREQSHYGAYNFVAPEILKDEPSNCKVDIWSLGATVWEMATGEVPFKGLECPQVILKIIKQMCLDPDDRICQEVETFIGLCAQKCPGDRPSATELLFTDFLASQASLI